MKYLAFLLLLVYYSVNAQIVCGAKSNGKWGFINEKGSWIIKPRFDSVGYFYNGYATIYSKDKQQGLIDIRGNVIASPTYAFVGNAEDNMCLILVKKDDDWLTGYLNLEKSTIIPAQFEDGEDFSEGLAGIKNRYGKWGFIDKKGQLAILYQFDAVYDGFSSDTANVSIGDNDVYINKKGKITGNFTPRKPIKKFNIIGRDNRLGITTMTGDTVMRPIYDYFGYPQDSLRWYRLQGKFGLVTTKGRFITSAYFNNLTYFSNGLAPASIGNNWGFIKPDGTIGIPFKFQKARNFTHGLAAVKFNGHWGFIDSKGNWRIKPRLEDITDYFKDSHAKFETVVEHDYP